MNDSEASEDFKELITEVSLLVVVNSNLELISKVSLAVSSGLSSQDMLQLNDGTFSDISAGNLHSGSLGCILSDTQVKI